MRLHIHRHLRIVAWEVELALVLGDDREVHTQCVQDGIDGFEAWMCAWAEGFVQALAADACVFGNLRHAVIGIAGASLRG